MGMLTAEQIAFYHEHGYIHIPNVFTKQEAADLKTELDWMIKVWANVGVGWTKGFAGRGGSENACESAA